MEYIWYGFIDGIRYYLGLLEDIDWNNYVLYKQALVWLLVIFIFINEFIYPFFKI